MEVENGPLKDYFPLRTGGCHPRHHAVRVRRRVHVFTVPWEVFVQPPRFRRLASGHLKGAISIWAARVSSRRSSSTCATKSEAANDSYKMDDQYPASGGLKVCKYDHCVGWASDHPLPLRPTSPCRRSPGFYASDHPWARQVLFGLLHMDLLEEAATESNIFPSFWD